MSFEFTETVTLYMPTIERDIKNLKEAAGDGSEKKLIAELAAIHEGLTANYNNYRATELEASLATWVQPYPKPIITNHDQYSESLGRVMAARMDKEADGTPYIRLQVAINGTDNVERCLDERFLTGSVGGKAESAKCSICNVDWAQAEGYKLPCKHERGKIYNGKLAYMELSGLSWKEYSFVNVPADAKSGFRKAMADATTGEGDVEDSWVRAVSFYALDMNKESIMEFSESQKPHEVLTEMKKKDAHVTYLNVKGTFLSVSAYELEQNNINNTEEKSTFNKTHTTIDDELRQETQAQKAAEENDDMSQKSQEDKEDILSVTEQLSADLASKGNDEASATEGDEKESTDETVETETAEGEEKEETAATEESSETSDTKTDTEAEVTSEENKEEEGSDTTSKEEQLASEKDIESADELANKEGETETKSEESTETEESTDDSKAQIESLLEENAKLKKSLHFMLAERVVDAKITLGILESSARAAELQEHTQRTASSLADAIRDLEKMPVPTSTRSTITLGEKALASGTDKSSPIEDEGDQSETKTEVISEQQRFEDHLVDVMMNRKKL